MSIGRSVSFTVTAADGCRWRFSDSFCVDDGRSPSHIEATARQLFEDSTGLPPRTCAFAIELGEPFAWEVL